ncbi:MAG: hypothetical protein MI923_14310 [Phycisphaerales bacterium]|nr:hypothetical protein [Phycisphaerales bacterium]
MTQAPAISRDDQPPQTARASSGYHLVQRIRLLSAMVVSALVFWYFGWWAAKPNDPKGPVTLLMVEQGVVTMAEMLGLAVVVSGLAVAICGAGSAERGPLAVAVGLAALGLRGGQMDRLVLHRLTSTSANDTVLDPYPVWSFIAETWLWIALIGVGFVVGRWVESWFDSATEDAAQHQHEVNHATDIHQGVGTVAVAFFIAWTIVSFATGSYEAPLLKGQIYFALIFAFLLASLVAHWFFQMSARVWTLLAVALVATAGYVYGQPEIPDGAYSTGTYVTLSSLARPVPLEYAALGSIGVLLEADFMSVICATFGLSESDRERPSGTKG